MMKKLLLKYHLRMSLINNTQQSHTFLSEHQRLLKDWVFV